MGLLILLQVTLDLAFIAIVVFILIERTKSKQQENSHLSRGLQLLTSKIAILQDLMDRSETQSRQLTAMIDNKQREIQEKLEDVEIHLNRVNQAMEKSREVAKIFQDRIPHQEIIERQNTYKYIQAAKLAHQGFTIDDIAKQVDIPRGELELIIKVNRDRMIFDNPPAWIESADNYGQVNQSAAPAPAQVAAKAPTPAAPAHIPAVVPAATQEAQYFDKKAIRPVIFKKLSDFPDLGS